MEAYLKYTFSRNILVFSIAWMGTRDIYIAIIITALFIFMVDYLLNEDSVLCCLPESFTTYHTSLMDENISEDEIKKAKELLEKAEKQKEEKEKAEKAEKAEQTQNQNPANNVVSENFLARNNYHMVQ
jgi:predicted tellurium resistance membrane protein TerC